MDWVKGVQRLAARALHYRANPKKYPKVNVDDVQLEKPRFGFRKHRPPVIHQLVRDELFLAPEIRKRYLAAGKPVPIRYSLKADEIARRNHEKFKDEVALGLPHFKVGHKKVYLPKARVCLLRPNAKHTPYQAKFLVPRNFNKMDLRDYLWHVYGLRALNVTVQLLHARFTRGMQDHARYRAPQYKKMTIDMEEPFVWPALPEGIVEKSLKMREDQLDAIALVTAPGSDQLKPTDAFDGLYEKPVLPNIFVSRTNQKVLAEERAKATARADAQNDRDSVARYLGL